MCVNYFPIVAITRECPWPISLVIVLILLTSGAQINLFGVQIGLSFKAMTYCHHRDHPRSLQALKAPTMQVCEMYASYNLHVATDVTTARVRGFCYSQKTIVGNINLIIAKSFEIVL